MGNYNFLLNYYFFTLERFMFENLFVYSLEESRKENFDYRMSSRNVSPIYKNHSGSGFNLRKYQGKSNLNRCSRNSIEGHIKHLKNSSIRREISLSKDISLMFDKSVGRKIKSNRWAKRHHNHDYTPYKVVC